MKQVLDTIGQILVVLIVFMFLLAFPITDYIVAARHEKEVKMLREELKRCRTSEESAR